MRYVPLNQENGFRTISLSILCSLALSALLLHRNAFLHFPHQTGTFDDGDDIAII